MDLNEFSRVVTQPGPAYLVLTDQAYLRQRVLDICLAQVEEAARPFDWSTHDLETQPPGEALARARTLPWMSSRRWVYIRGAELAEEALLAYLKNPCETTVMVLEVSKKPRSWPVLPAVDVEVGDKVLGWVQKRVRKEGLAITPDAAGLLIELVGSDLLALDSEIEKLILWAWESRVIDADAVQQQVAEARQRDVFELSRAMGSRRRESALGILNRLLESGARAQQIIPLLYWTFKRLLVAREQLEDGVRFNELVRTLQLWSFRDLEAEVRKYPRALLADIVVKLREADRLFKSSGAEPRVHLERLIVDTCRSRSL